MKKITFIFSFLFLLITSCTSKEECFSCNSEIDSWVKQNKIKLEKMSRKELSKFDLEKQRAALRMFTPERKKSLWTDKLNEVLKYEFTYEEKNHVKFLESLLKNHTFDNSFTDSQNKEVLLWIEEGMDNFGWTPSFIVNSFFTIGTNFSHKVLYNNSVDCGCNYNIACYPHGCDSSGGCSASDGGCGVFGGADCEGECPY